MTQFKTLALPLLAMISAVFSTQISSAQSVGSFSVVSNCRPVTQLATPFFAGLSQIQSIKSVKVELDQAGAKMSMNVDIFEKGYGATPDRVVNKTESFSFGSMKTGSMVEWTADAANSIEIHYVITHHTEVHVVTAGPVPPGTYKSEIDLVLISSYPTGRATTGVLHLPLTCDETYRY